MARFPEIPPDQLPPGVPEGTVWFGGPIDSAKVTLRVFGEDVDPIEITRLLGCHPSSSAKTGEVVTANGHTRTVREGFWRLESEGGPTDIEEQLLRLLSRVTDDVQVWHALVKKYRVDLFCGLYLDASNRGFELSPKLIRELASRGVVIGFDIYAPDPPP